MSSRLLSLLLILLTQPTHQHEFHILKDRESVGNEVARRVAEAVKRASPGEFRIALSGGSALTLLSKGILQDKDDLEFRFEDWKVAVVDERLNDVDSNMLACRNVLLDSVGVENIFPVDPALYDDPESAAKDYERVLKKDFPDFHVIIMGMGGDGHTASLFPNHEFWDGYGGDELVAPVFDSPKPPSRRITMTPKALRSARETFFVVVGASKSEKVKELMSISDEMKSKAEKKEQMIRFPASLATSPAEWFLDEDAYYGDREEL